VVDVITQEIQPSDNPGPGYYKAYKDIGQGRRAAKLNSNVERFSEHLRSSKRNIVSIRE
jgi:hypothetical protein